MPPDRGAKGWDFSHMIFHVSAEYRASWAREDFGGRLQRVPVFRVLISTFVARGVRRVQEQGTCDWPQTCVNVLNEHIGSFSLVLFEDDRG